MPVFVEACYCVSETLQEKLQEYGKTIGQHLQSSGDILGQDRLKVETCWGPFLAVWLGQYEKSARKSFQPIGKEKSHWSLPVQGSFSKTTC
jgi:hypothetical protein